MTQKRMKFLMEFLPFIGLTGRLRLEWISSAEANRFVKVVTEFTEQIRQLGPSPLAKGRGSLDAFEIPPVLQAAGGSGCACSHSHPAPQA